MHGRSSGRRAASRIGAALRPIIEAAEDHFAGGGLQNAGNHYVHGLGDHPPRIIHHHHRAVVQVGNALIVLFALFQNENAHHLAWQNHRPQGVGEFIDIQHGKTLYLSQLVEIEIVCDDFGVHRFGQLNQLQVHFPHQREVFARN